MLFTKFRRRWALAIIIAALLLAAAFIGGMALQDWQGAGDGPEITAELLGEQIANISELAVLEYRYTNVGKFEDQVNFYGWEVPFTTKSFILVYDGSMKLGINGSEVALEVAGQEIRIKLPPVKILSHEIMEDTLVVMDQTHNVFNQLQIEDYTGFAVDQKIEMEEKARERGLFTDALERAEAQIGDFLRLLPGIGEEYTIVFIS